MTLTDLENYVLNFTQTSYATGPWTQAEVQQYLRDEELRVWLHVARKSDEFFRTQTTLGETANQATLSSWPTNVHHVVRVERVAGASATTTSPIVMRPVPRDAHVLAEARGTVYPYYPNNNTTVPPWYYQLHGAKALELVPTPTVTIASSIRITYIYRPAAMTAGTHVPFQITAGVGGTGTDDLAEFHDIIALGAIEKCLMKEESTALSDRVKALRLERLQELTDFVSPTGIQEPQSMIVTDAELE